MVQVRLICVAHIISPHDAACSFEALSGQYAIAILDVMMPRMNGIETLRRIRAASRIPVLMLTGRGDDADRILGLELGADDYVTKPCTPRELTARVRAILRRTQGASSEGPGITLTVGKLTMLPEQRRATWDGNSLELTSTEFNLLEVLARNAGARSARTTCPNRDWGARWRASTVTSTST
jgi:two-component system OmpR family response regulator